MLTDRAHRYHCSAHDYYDRGIYLITIVVNEAERAQYRSGTAVFGRLRKDADLTKEHGQELVELTPVGKAVLDSWKRIPEIQAKKSAKVSLMEAVVMPDHFHGILFVEEKSPVSVGQMIWGMKVGCAKAYHTAKFGIDQNDNTASCQEPYLTPLPDLHNMSRAQRAAYYEEQKAKGTYTQTPLFEDNYDDTVLWHKGQLQAMRDYVQDNPRRAIIQLRYPDFYQRRMHIRIDGIDDKGQPTKREYAAFGNLFLLRYPWMEQVMCHRWKINGLRRDYDTPYIQTEEYHRQHDKLINMAEQGAVLVTPGISKGEQNIKNECIERGLPLIHLQKEHIGPRWKPEKERFKACEEGKLLILAPWGLEQMADQELCLDGQSTNIVPADTSYSQFHNMNNLAAEICRGICSATLRME